MPPPAQLEKWSVVFSLALGNFPSVPGESYKAEKDEPQRADFIPRTKQGLGGQ